MLTRPSLIDAQPVYNDHHKLSDAKQLYNQAAYVAAKEAFSEIAKKSSGPEVRYYLAMSAIKAGDADGEALMTLFLQEESLHVYARKAHQELANYYFANARYDKALESYNQTSIAFDPELIFRKGYCEFKLKQYEDALTTFEMLEGTFSSRQKDAAYFQGYIHFEKEALAKAKEFLTKALESDQFRVASIKLLAAMLYENQQHPELVDLLSGKLETDHDAQLIQMLADAQFALEKYRSAADSYRNLLDHHEYRNALNYYKGGLSHFKIEDMEMAMDFLSKAAISDDETGAFASYYLGLLHADKGNYEFAISSFENCAKYQTTLKEDALYLQANNLMQIPNYESAIDVLKNYAEAFPAGKYSDQINQLTGIAYANTNNYDLAIDYIERLERLTPQLKKTYQRTTFLKGANLFNDKKFEEASAFFQKALIHDIDQEITQKTFYWMAEAMSLLGNLDEALFYYNSVARTPDKEVFINSIYGKSYANFNLKDYQLAADGFRQFDSYSGERSSRYTVDAWIRLGDCLFALKSYQAGIAYYKKAGYKSARNKEYINFQIGLLYRYLDDDKNARKYFNQLISESPEGQRAAEAHFQLAQIEFENGNEKQAISSYQIFLSKYPTSPLVPFALLNQGIAYDNAGNAQACIANYQKILDHYARHKTANSALLGLQDKYADGQFEQFNQYLELYKQANPNSEALENIEFETARSKYYSQSYQEAVSELEKFIINYPQSSFLMDARYLIAESYYRMAKQQEALDAFLQLSGADEYSKYTKVLYRLASLYSAQGDLSQGNQYYHKLAGLSNSNRNTLNVLNGLMENHYEAQVHDSAVYYGELLLRNPRIDAWVESNAHLVVGKSYYQLGQLEKARDSFLPLISNTPDEHGAEAYYFISKIYYDQAKYENALDGLFTLTNNFQAYEKWLGAAYLLMADIYIETDKLFQAKATLQSVIDHVESEEIKSKAKDKLATIKDHVDNNE